MAGQNSHFVQVAGTQLSSGSAAIHFYYSQAEQRRFLVFLLDGSTQGEGVILASVRSAREVLGRELESARPRGARALIRLELADSLPQDVHAIAEAVQASLRRHRHARVLADFGSLVPMEKIFELEAALSAALRDLPVVCLTQYDGRSVPAPVTIEQFKTHALAVVGNVLYNENKDYTPPENYVRQRAARNTG